LFEVLTPDGTALGAVGAKTLVRAEEETRTHAEIKQRQKKLPKISLKEKESFRWLEGYRETIKLAKQNSQTTCVCVGDSESDIFEVFLEPREENAHLLVRLCQDRVIEGIEPYHPIRSTVYATPVIAAKNVFVRARTPSVSATRNTRQQVRKSRDALLEIRKTTVMISPPTSMRKRCASVRMNIVLVSEKAPPEGESAVEWILLTTLPITALEEVLNVIQYYETRWMIEVFFKTLKSGCKVESLQFEEMSRLLPCLAVYVIVSWRVLIICRLGRSHPDWNCEVIFSPEEWKATYCIMHPKKKLPVHPPSLDFMIRLVGTLGGWVSTPGKKEMPGPHTTWIGLQ
jgi:hypothetical protein